MLVYWSSGLYFLKEALRKYLPILSTDSDPECLMLLLHLMEDFSQMQWYVTGQSITQGPLLLLRFFSWSLGIFPVALYVESLPYLIPPSCSSSRLQLYHFLSSFYQGTGQSFWQTFQQLPHTFTAFATCRNICVELRSVFCDKSKASLLQRFPVT